ncbi:hypothetical protein C7M84_008048 [Penaeus vannamei]|uniref:Uncharacterized protein n=1 Tax=Penaeus vannamei TaxID=6689 RepID=A0A423TAI7_PENVA|nr:hypothetical protein C7M84_008048 [Penaeus vannamei]
MEAEKENMQSGLKPLRSLTLLRRHRTENDMSIEDFLREDNQSHGSQQPLLKQNRSTEKTVKWRELQPTNGQEEYYVQNEEQRETGQGIYGNYQPRMPMSNMVRLRSVQADIPHESKSVSGGDPSLNVGMDEQNFRKAFRRRRSAQADISHEANSMRGGKKEAFEKMRHLIEKAREQRKLALLKSNPKATPRTRLTPLRLTQVSAQRRGHLMSSKRRPQGIARSSGMKVEKKPDNMQLSKSSKAGNPAGVMPVIGKPVQKKQALKDTKAKVQGRTPNIRRRSKDLKFSVVVSSEPSSQTVEVQTSPAAVKSDASTNTQIRYAYGRSLDPKLMNELETLSKEQDDIEKEALLIRERTAMRQEKMREDGILDSFAATISPLKRLKAMLQEKKTFVHSTKKEYDSLEMGSQSQINKSVQFSETPIFYEVRETDDQQEEYGTPDTSIQMCNSLNASLSHWNSLKGNNSFLQTPVSKKEPVQSAREEKEEFIPPTNDVPAEKSPFTEIAGNCERPSLAPLTPHSRKEVSVLKLILRKQLEDLYD